MPKLGRLPTLPKAQGTYMYMYVIIHTADLEIYKRHLLYHQFSMGYNFSSCQSLHAVDIVMITKRETNACRYRDDKTRLGILSSPIPVHVYFH